MDARDTWLAPKSHHWPLRWRCRWLLIFEFIFSRQAEVEVTLNDLQNERWRHVHAIYWPRLAVTRRAKGRRVALQLRKCTPWTRLPVGSHFRKKEKRSKSGYEVPLYCLRGSPVIRDFPHKLSFFLIVQREDIFVQIFWVLKWNRILIKKMLIWVFN